MKKIKKRGYSKVCQANEKKLYKKIRELESKLDNHDKKLKKYKKENKELKKENKELKKENKEVKMLLRKAENDLLTKDQKIEEIQEQSKKQLEEFQEHSKKQLDEKDQIIARQKAQIAQLKKLAEKEEALKNELEKEKAKNNRTSQTTSTPTGRSIDTPNSEIKAKAANTYNSREKTNRKRGGQPGHKGQTLSHKTIEKIKSDPEFLVKIVDFGSPDTPYTSYYEIDIVVQPILTEKRIHQDYKNSGQPVVKSRGCNIAYGKNIKALSTILNVTYNLPLGKIESLLKVFTEGKIDACRSSIYNWVKSFAKPARERKIQLEKKLLQQDTIYTDSTVMVVNGKNRNNVRVCVADGGPTIFTALTTKTKDEMSRKTILGRFDGTLVSDHEYAVFGFGSKRQECLAHILRYLKKNQVEAKHDWAFDMQSLLNMCIHERKKLLQNGDPVERFDEETIRRIDNKYDQIVQEGYRQNEQDDKAWYYKEERALLNRLVKFKKETLYFLEDFKTMPDNNLSERSLRSCKLKQKNSGGFRTYEGLQRYCHISNLVGNCPEDDQPLHFLRSLI